MAAAARSDPGAIEASVRQRGYVTAGGRVLSRLPLWLMFDVVELVD
jgi:hypothetical protein